MDETLVVKAVIALQKYHSTVKRGARPKLIEADPLVSLVIALKKIPDRTIRPLRVPLPHTLYPLETTELCLITKKEKSEVKEEMQAKGVHGVSKVIPISKLKTNYKSFEAKRLLSASYDVFLADRRLYQMLPRLLGKKFFEKKKFPIPVDLQKKDLAFEIHRARDSTYLHIGLGSCCHIPVGRVGFPPEDLCSNITSAIMGVASHIPRGLKNIQSVHLKTPDSIALPIHSSLPPPPGLLPAAADETPATKRIKLDIDSNEMFSSKPEENLSEERGQRSAGLTFERSLNCVAEGGEEARRSGRESESKGKKKTKLSKLSVKKIRGSTVRSSKYEKALKRKTAT